jgi:conjugal transfer pilus assembly protein TraE
VHIRKSLSQKENYRIENRLLRFAILVIGVVVIFNSVMIVKALRYQKIVLVPQGLEAKAVITGTRLDEAYVSAIVRSMASLAFSYTPAVARRQFDELLTYYDPDAYPAGKTTFYNLAEKIEATKASAAFFPSKIIVDTDRKRVEVVGMGRQFIDDRKIEDRQKTYWIDYTVNNGRFSIVQIAEAHRETPPVGKEGSRG